MSSFLALTTRQVISPRTSYKISSYWVVNGLLMQSPIGPLCRTSLPLGTYVHMSDLGTVPWSRRINFRRATSWVEGVLEVADCNLIPGCEEPCGKVQVLRITLQIASSRVLSGSCLHREWSGTPRDKRESGGSTDSFTPGDCFSIWQRKLRHKSELIVYGKDAN